MSVNEVKLKKATKAFEVRGTGPARSRTFAIGDEDHTLGNALRHVLMQSDSRVGFAGYSIAHPAEPVVQIRVQTIVGKNGDEDAAITAMEALQTSCDTLHAMCNIAMEKLEDLLPEVREDRLSVEKRKEELKAYEDQLADQEEEMDETAEDVEMTDF